MMNSQKDPLALPVIKQEFDDDLISSVEGWSPLTGNTATNSSLPLSTTSTQSGENRFSPIATTSNYSSKSPFPSHNFVNTYSSVASVHKRPNIARQGLVKKVRNNNRSFIANHNNSIPNGLQRNNNIELLFSLELQLKQTQEQLKEMTLENRNSNEILEKKYDKLQLDYVVFKTNANIKLNKLQMDNDKLYNKLNQLKNHTQTRIERINSQPQPKTTNQSQLNFINHQNVNTINNIHNFLTTPPVNSTSTVQIKQEIIDDDSTCPEMLYNLINDVEQNIGSRYSSLLSDISSQSQASENILQTGNSSVSLDVSNLSNSNDQQDYLPQNLVSLASDASLTDQNVTKMQHIKQEFTDDDPCANKNDRFNVADNSSCANQSSDINRDEVILENKLPYEDEDNLDQDNDDNEEESNTTNNNEDNSVVKLIDPSTAQQHSNRIVFKTPTFSNLQNLHKRKQSQPNRKEKRSKKTIDDKDEEEEVEEYKEVNQIDDKIKVLHLDCTQQNCKIKFKTTKHLQEHLKTAHGLLPLRCFAQNCNMRFDHSSQMKVHLKLDHSKPTKFVCPVCCKESASQNRTYGHWSHYHLNGQFECNLNECSLVYDTRRKLYDHQRHKHCPQSKRFKCNQDGCSATFVFKVDLERHKTMHLGIKPFHCKWPQCSHRTNIRSNLLKHIRTRQFGLTGTMKEQKEKNTADERDPNDYVRLVENEIDE